MFNHLRFLPSLPEPMQLGYNVHELYYLNCSCIFPSHFHFHENHLESTFIIVSLPLPKISVRLGSTRTRI